MAMQVLKFLVSIAVTVVLAIPRVGTVIPTTLAEKVILAFCVFLFWTSFELLSYGKRLTERDLQHGELWSFNTKFETILNDIRKHYHDIAKQFYGANDLFKDYFIQNLTSISDTIKNAAEKHELYVENYHFTRTELVLGAFEGDDSQILRYVWVLEENEPFFDDKWKHYFKLIDDMVKQKKIKEVRALLVESPGINMKDDRVLALLGFYSLSDRYSYRVISVASQADIARDNQLDEKYIDFGIYGKRYVFRTISYGPVTCGDFSKNPSLIVRYTKCFDIAWNSHGARQVNKKELKRTSLTQLFETDARTSGPS